MTDLTDAALWELAEKVAYSCDESGARHPAMACPSCITAKFIALRDAAYAEQRERDAKIASVHMLPHCHGDIPQSGHPFCAGQIAAAIHAGGKG